MTRGLLLLCAVLSAALGWSLWRAETHKGAAEAAAQSAREAQAAVASMKDTLETERSRTQDMADIGERHEQDREEAATVPAAVADDLRAGNLRLRREWAGCETARLSDSAAATLERDALAASRDQLAGAVVRVGRDADDQLRACQAVIRADRERVR